MNGRVYDYNVGRFLSVDPFIHGAGNSQGINPYSYILNNPLAGTDPSGYSPGGLTCPVGNGMECTDFPKDKPKEKRDGRRGKGGSWETVYVNNGFDTSSKSSDASQIGAKGKEAAENIGEPSRQAKKMAEQFSDPEDRANEYERIGKELIELGHTDAGNWFLLASEQVHAIDYGFEAITGGLALFNNGGEGAVDAMSVVSQVSLELSAHNFQSYLDIKANGSIKGLEGIRGKSLAIEMASFEQRLAQKLLVKSLSWYNPSMQSKIVSNINERFNGGWDRFWGYYVTPDYVSNTIDVLNKRHPNHDFSFYNEGHRFGLAVGLVNKKYSGE